MSIIAIDPGMRNTGLVHMDGRSIHDVLTISWSGAVRDDQHALLLRAYETASTIARWIADKPHEAVVIEGFLNYCKRQSGYTFQTPYLCGYIHAALATEHFIIQTSRQVLNPRTRGNVAAYKAAMEKGSCPWEGSEKLTNDHLRSAAAHGIYYYIHREEGA